MTKFKEDLIKYKKYSNKNSLILLLTTQGLWALFWYRIFSRIHFSNFPFFIKRISNFVYVFIQKIIEILTGISIPYSAKIGSKFYIGHFGNIIIHPKTIIGKNCNISQGVTIGVSGRGKNKGIPIIGDNVYIGANAIVVGKIIIGDNSVIGANSLVIKDVEPSSTYIGVPAEKKNNYDSSDFI